MPTPETHRQLTAGMNPADPLWKAWDDAWTRQAATLTGRDDLTVVVAPGAGGGAPETFYPRWRRVEVDATYVADTPDIADPRRPGHKRLVPTGYGLLVHAAAHAAHSRWDPPPGTHPILAAVSAMLEESRAEGRQRGRRRGDRRWLRHTVTTLIGVDDAPVDDPWHAGVIAALLLARVDARILTSKDARAARAAVTGVLGRARLRRLREIWRQAQATDDTDADAMIDLARQWCKTLGVNLHTRQVPTADPGEFPGQLAAALVDYLATASGQSVPDYTARDLARRHDAPSGWSRTDPTNEEERAARVLADRLRRARQPEPGRRPSPIPPGRLRTRDAIAADAQTAAGAIPAVAPWQQRAMLPPDKPRLHLAVLVDLSGSMRAYTGPLSSAAWILAHAARRLDAVTTTIAFGNHVTILQPPRSHPTQVLHMQAGGGTYTFPNAVKVADQLLNLRHKGSLRMLAVVSDGDLDDKPAAQKLITTLHRTGCAILWLRPAGMSGHTFTDTTTIAVADPADAIRQITDAALAAVVAA